MERLDCVVLRLAQRLFHLVYGIHKFDSGHVLQCPESLLLLLGPLLLDFPDDLVLDLALAAFSVTATLGIGL
jgi:hypothetical protein